MKSVAILFCALAVCAYAEDSDESTVDLDEDEVVLVLENKSGQECDLFWKPASGEQHVQTIGVGEVYAQKTFAGEKVCFYNIPARVSFAKTLMHNLFLWRCSS
jgi:hypothetical protein